MPGRQDDDPAGRTGRGGSTATAPAPTPPSRSLLLGTAVALAVAATLVAVLTGDAAVLRACVVVAAWAGVGAAYVAVRQLAERRAAAAREAALRRAYDRELDLADADRRESELELENDLRREADQALREELGRLHEQSEELTRLREQMARISGLGDSLAGLARLREDVAALGALRGDVAALGRLTDGLGQLAGLRDELAALRSELTEKIDAEMLVERVLLRTRGVRLPERALESAVVAEEPEPLPWTEVAPRELTGGWTGFRLDQPPATREYETVGRERAWEPATVERSAVAPEPVDDRGYDGGRVWDPLTDPLEDAPPAVRSRHAGLRDDELPAWRVARDRPPASAWEPDGPTTGPVAAQRPKPVPHRRRSDEARDLPADPAHAATTEHPAHRAAPRPPETTAAPAVERPAPPRPDTAGHTRLSEILAESAAPQAGGRRRRRYRDDGETDDVLSRVLRGE